MKSPHQLLTARESVKTAQDLKDLSPWIERFRKDNGRLPKILHIGNVANNAYNNAKLLNARGIPCDVICYDYYHIMGCPEWEDADFKGRIKDQFHPNWRRVNRRGFKRPDWFAQGPLWFCIQYLLAKSQGHRARKGIFRFVCQLPHCQAYFLLNALFKIRSIIAKMLRYNLSDILAPRFSLKHSPFVSATWPFSLIPISILLLFFGLVLSLIKIIGWFLKPMTSMVWSWGAYYRSKQDSIEAFDKRVHHLIEQYKACFPDRSDPLTPSDFAGYRHWYSAWSHLISRYDLIEAYATDTIHPMLSGNRPYIAYEHGTIRDIPFEDSALGRLCALSYRLANTAIITNPDCATAAKRLNLTSYLYMPHVLDGKYHNLTGLYDSPNPLILTQPYIFSPSRHDWAIKGNQHAIQGFALFARKYPEYKLVLSKWGND
ncbi:hypothetical protein MEO93_28735, partial [Dolichospermum sp. ST_sed3]|nr:hypothetical protein [Dolichospermum sp. ST_sed3]